jgi:hypothetical protein
MSAPPPLPPPPYVPSIRPMGVHISAIRTLARRARELSSSEEDDVIINTRTEKKGRRRRRRIVTTADVCERIVLPDTRARRESYLDILLRERARAEGAREREGKEKKPDRAIESRGEMCGRSKESKRDSYENRGDYDATIRDDSEGTVETEETEETEVTKGGRKTEAQRASSEISSVVISPSVGRSVVPLVAPATHFVSHAWSCRFDELLSVLEEVAQDAQRSSRSREAQSSGARRKRPEREEWAVKTNGKAPRDPLASRCLFQRFSHSEALFSSPLTDHASPGPRRRLLLAGHCCEQPARCARPALHLVDDHV